MAAVHPFTIFLLTVTVTVTASDYTPTSLYLSPKTLFPNYQKMLQSFKIFIYAPPPTTTPTTLFTTPQQHLFYTSLIHSPFITQDPNHAHLFLLPFPSSISTRNLARVVRSIRINFPFWNRTLGADHFYLSAAGVGPSSDRNVVELKKNSIQVSCFPTSSGLFIPHKDVTLPPVHKLVADKYKYQVGDHFDSKFEIKLINQHEKKNEAPATTSSKSLLGYVKPNDKVVNQFDLEVEIGEQHTNTKLPAITRQTTTSSTPDKVVNQFDLEVKTGEQRMNTKLAATTTPSTDKVVNQFDLEVLEQRMNTKLAARTPFTTERYPYLGYLKLTDKTQLNLIEEIKEDHDFKVESEVEVETENKKQKFVKNSRFCLFVYGSEMTWMVEAMGAGCVPVVITDRPIQDLPLMDVIDWSEMAVFVGASGGVKGLKRVLDGIGESRYEKMVESGVAAVQHLVWNAEPQAHDAFHMVVYQLWLRRHTIRYARWVEQ